MQSKLKTSFHGEVIFYQVNELPRDVISYIPAKEEMVGDKLIVGKSETTGNHHVVETDPSKIEFYEKDGQLYMKVKEPVIAGCVITGRHDDMIINPGIYKKKVAKQFDYFKMSKELVKD
jgi:hypothetical protein